MARSGGKGFCIDEMTCYIQTGVTGTGSAQNVAHNLGQLPDLVVVTLRDSNSNEFAQGTHTAANLVLTVTNNAVFDIRAYKFKYPTT